MPPRPQKRQKGEGSSSTAIPQFDKKKFQNAAVAERFEYVLGKALIPERGLRPDPVDGQMNLQIHERRWHYFTQQPEAAVVAIVKEFYANTENAPPFKAFVRGKMVDFGAETINAFYNITPPAVCQYTELRDGGIDYDQILTEICKPDTVWVIDRRKGTIIPSSTLNYYGKVWYSFLCAKLLPSTHTNDITKEKISVLYAIVKDLSINIGTIINFSIRRCLQGGLTGGLPHPSLITGLCLQAGVVWAPNEPIQPPLMVLDSKLMNRFKPWKGAPSHPRGLGFIFPDSDGGEDEAEDEDYVLPDDEVEADAPSNLTNAMLSDIQRQLTKQRKIHSQQRKRTDRVAARQSHIFNNQIQFQANVAAAFARITTGSDPMQFHTPQPLPAYPPSDSDSKKGGGPDA